MRLVAVRAVQSESGHMNTAFTLYRMLTVEGKKLLIDMFINRLFSNKLYRFVWNKTRESAYEKGDPEWKALKHPLSQLVIENSKEIEQYFTEDIVDFDSFGYYEEQIQEKLKNY